MCQASMRGLEMHVPCAPRKNNINNIDTRTNTLQVTLSVGLDADVFLLDINRYMYLRFFETSALVFGSTA